VLYLKNYRSGISTLWEYFTAIGDNLLFIKLCWVYILSSVDELSPEKPFVVKLLTYGLVPAYGISFVDENSVFCKSICGYAKNCDCWR